MGCSSKGGGGSADSSGSASVSLQPLAPVVLLQPAVNPLESNSAQLTLAGSCRDGAVVYLSGAESKNEPCVASSFSIILSPAAGGELDYRLVQRGAGAADSSAVAFRWNRNLSLPLTPEITSPAALHFSAADRLTISGTCLADHTVELSGAETASQPCEAGKFSFTVLKSADGEFLYSVLQRTADGVASGTTGVIWQRDTKAPETPVVRFPAAFPHYSNGSSLALTGECESAATVYLNGPAQHSAYCSNGSFSFNVELSQDSTYRYEISQTDRAGNASARSPVEWIRDTQAPAVPVISGPPSPRLSRDPSLSLSGSCESGSVVQVRENDAASNPIASASCESGLFSLTITQDQDGTFPLLVSQRDRAGNQSVSAGLVWQRDTTAPPAPVITSPAVSPHLTSGSQLILSGSCESGATVRLSGASQQSKACVSAAFSFSLDQSADGVYDFSLIQTDPAGNASAATAFQWSRDSTIPPAPLLVAPASNPFYSNGGTLALSGTCSTGFKVELSGDSAGSAVCSSGQFSFSVSKSVDGAYQFALKQISQHGVSSAPVSLTWNRVTAAPPALVLVSPATKPYYSNGSSVTLSGSCVSGNTVKVSGAASASTMCASNAFSIAVSKSADGTYDFVLNQSDLAGNVSSGVLATWVRDTLSPDQLTVTNPGTNPYTSADNELRISGACEPSATVSLTGDATESAVCPALGTFSFTVAKSTDQAYQFTLRQSDRAGNSSSTTTLTWDRDTSIPTTPVVSAPVSNPYHSNTSTITITASCDPEIGPSPALVTLGGDVEESEVVSPAGALSQECASSPVTFVVQKSTEQTFAFLIRQDNPNNSMSSADAVLRWVRDTTAPAAPLVTNPSTSPYTAPGNLTIAGQCEPNAVLSLSGDDAAVLNCSLEGTFEHTVVKSADGTYNFNLLQADLAGNFSAVTRLQWVRDTGSVSAPVIQSPAVSPLTGNSPSLTISGLCTAGQAVELGGDVTADEVVSPAGSLVQECASGSFLYTIAKSADGTYQLSLRQLFNSVYSAAAVQTWICDTSPPAITLTEKPAATNLSTSASFAFSSSEAGSTFQCKLDTAAYASCTSPVTFSSLTNGSHSFSVRGTDGAGNLSVAVTYQWTQSAFKALAIYHLNSSAPAQDSGNYGNTLTASGAPANDATGVLPSGAPSSRSFGTGNSYSAASSAFLNLGSKVMTVEGRVKLTSLPATGQYYTLVSKTAASPALGWEVRLRRVSNTKHVLDFVVSQNGTSSTTVTSNNLPVSANSWNYFAVTWDQGKVSFYLGTNAATARGTATVGTLGTASIFAGSAPLRLGANASSGTAPSMWLAGSLDEVRISQVVRVPSVSSAEYGAD